MKHVNNKLLVMLGLVGALAINSSQIWGSGEEGSGDFASSSKTIESCIQKALNKSHYKRNLFKCVDKKRGIVATGKLRGTKRSKHGAESVDSKDSVTARFKGSKKAPVANEKTSVEQVETLEATITVARMVDPDCDDCGKKIRSEVLYRDTGDNAVREDFSDTPDMMATELIEQTQDLMAAIDEDLKEHRKEKKKEDKIARKYKMCITDEDGDEFEDDYDKNTCIEEQLAELKGKDLIHFLNTRLVPHLLFMEKTDPDAARDLFGQISSIERGGVNGLYLGKTMQALNQFKVLDSRRNQDIQKAHYYARRDPNMDIRQELDIIGQIYGDQALQYIGSDPMMNSVLGPQLNSYHTTLSTGVPPISLLSDSQNINPEYLNSGTVRTEYLNSGTPYRSRYSDNSTYGSAGLQSQIKSVYPTYTRNYSSTGTKGASAISRNSRNSRDR